MKKTLVLLAIAVMGLGLTVSAQEPVKRKGQQKTENARPLVAKDRKDKVECKKDLLRIGKIERTQDNRQLRAQPKKLQSNPKAVKRQNEDNK